MTEATHYALTDAAGNWLPEYGVTILPVGGRGGPGRRLALSRQGTGTHVEGGRWLPVVPAEPPTSDHTRDTSVEPTYTLDGDTLAESVTWIGPDLSYFKQHCIKAVEDWYETHPGIVVDDGVVLPVQQGPRTVNASAFSLFAIKAMADPSTPFRFTDVRYNVHVVDGVTAYVWLELFDSAFEKLASTRQTKLEAIASAVDVAAVEAVTIPEHNGEPVDARV